MEKPKGYDEAQAYGMFDTLPPGGYKCVIKQVETGKSQNEKEYIKIAFDIAEGEKKDFYSKKFDADTRKEKKWSGVWVVFTEGYEAGTTNPKFKGLITSVEESNGSFKFNWDEQTLVGKKVGIVFREEEFRDDKNVIRTAVKPFYAVSYEKAETEKIPNFKKIERNALDDPLFSNTPPDFDMPF